MALLLAWLPMVAAALDEPSSLRLLAHSSFHGPSPVLKESDWRWLRERRTLLMGISAPDYAPFDLTNNNGEFQGITADFAALISQALNVTIEVRSYETRDEVIEALKQGAVDFIGSANGYEAADPQLVMSRAYANDQPTLVTRTGDSQALTSDLAGKRVAMLYHYLPPEMVRGFYPDARLELFSSTFEAIGAVAFGRADVYLGDAISTNYLINRNHLNNVRMVDFSTLEVSPFAFALTRDNKQLLAIINAALTVVPASEQMEILRRWSGGNLGIVGAERLQLSASEQRWLEKHPRVKIAVPDNRVLLARQLSFLGHRIRTADEGNQGFELWKTAPADVVITDCNMPLKNGYALARDIRAYEREHGRVPCLLLGFTANAQPEETERCREAGMDGCLFKPAGLEDLRSALAALTDQASAAGQAAVVDLGALVSLTGDDRAALLELLAPLLDSLQADRALLSRLHSELDFHALHDLAHRVKGGAHMVRAHVLIACCDTLEAACLRQERNALVAAVEAVGVAIDDVHHGLNVYCNQP